MTAHKSVTVYSTSNDASHVTLSSRWLARPGTNEAKRQQGTLNSFKYYACKRRQNADVKQTTAFFIFLTFIRESHT